MAVCRHRCALGLSVLAALVLAAPAAAAPPGLHTGSTRYVRLVHVSHGRLSIALTATGRKRFRRALRGHVLDAECTTLGPTLQGFTESSESSEGEGSVGPGGRVTDRVLLDRHADFCDIGRARRKVTRRGESTTGVPGPPLDRMALTQKGAAYMDEDRVTQKIVLILDATVARAFDDPARRLPAAEKIAAESRGKVIALPSPDASPAPGVIGLFSDGASHAAAVALSALHQRLFIDSNAGALSTNAPEHVFRVVRGKVSTLADP